MNEPPPVAAPEDTGFRGWWRTMPRWKKVTLGVALVTVAVAGIVSVATTGSLGSDGAAGRGGGSMTGLSSNLTDRSVVGSGGAPTDEPASKGIFRVGFSFLAGFCIGTFLRATLKVAAIAIGFWLLATMALSYYDLLAVDWNAIGSMWDRFAANVQREWGSFQSFVTGSLPAAGLAVAGLMLGLKRK